MRRLYLALALLAARPAAADPLDVVTDIAPVATLVATAQGGRGTVAAIVGATGDPHHMALRPSQARALAGADLAVFVGASLTPWFDAALDRLAPDVPRVALLDIAPVRLPRRSEDGAGAAGEPATDPHAWLAPENAAAWLGAIAEALAAQDPAAAAAYRANAADGQAAIAAAGAAIAAARDARPPFAYVAAHDSFRYAEALAGADFAGAVADSHATAPGPARMAALERRLAEGGVACLLAERGEVSRLVRRLAESHGLPLVTVDLLAGAPGYGAWLTALHATLARCAGPAGGAQTDR